MTNNQLARRARRQLNRKKSSMAPADYKKAFDATFNKEIVTEWNKRLNAAKLNPWENKSELAASIAGFDLSNLWDWFSENWDEILRILLTLLPLFLRDSNENP